VFFCFPSLGSLLKPLETVHQSSVPAAAHYKGVKYNTGTEVTLRITNGGAGQSGLVGALASAFIDGSRENGVAQEDYVVR
jgi:hypothetical protein